MTALRRPVWTNERPDNITRHRNELTTHISKQKVVRYCFRVSTGTGNIKVDLAIIIVVGPGWSAKIGQCVYNRSFGNRLEGTIPLIMVEKVLCRGTVRN